jgi:predicted ArsR family transcriptional regulator
LRHCPRASAIYTVALRITKGGKNPFRVSNRNLAKYFGWHPETVREAMKALRQSGLFVLLRNGTGGEGRQNFASVYQVRTHSELAKLTRQQMCLNTLVASPVSRIGADVSRIIPDAACMPSALSGVGGFSAQGEADFS